MKGPGRVDPGGFLALDLRAHTLLRDVPLHDVWAVSLRGGGPGRSLSDVRAVFPRVETASPAVRALFRLRMGLGRLFGWDAEPRRSRERSYRARLSEQDIARSLVLPGTREGPFQVLYVHTYESVGEIENATVHAFSVLALREDPPDYTLYWAIYVKPVGRITPFYMALIDPFRRFFIYPRLLRQVEAAWSSTARARERSGRAAPG